MKVDTKVTDMPNNEVSIAIDVVEGKRSRIQQINVVGNTAFTEDELRSQFKLKTPNWLSWYRQDDKYSREELSGDIESLKSFYLDRGYADFDVETSQVAIAPEKEDIFITLNIREGDVYRVSDVKVAGDLVVPEQDLMALVQVRRGDIYSRKYITATTELMALRLGQDGYAFAKIDPVPQENPETKEISITFLVQPGNRAYVRHINFEGSSGINDDTLRREMRQMEGGYLSNAAVERSKQRLQRLPFIEKVDVETTPVPGTPDLVDVDFKVKEGLPGQFSGGIGYSQSQSVMLNASFVHSNFLGTGNRIAAELNAGQYSQVYSISHTDPYVTVDGVSRTVSMSYRKYSQYTSSSSQFDTTTGALGLDYGWPLSEFQSRPRRSRRAALRPLHGPEPERRAVAGVGAEQWQHVHAQVDSGYPTHHLHILRNQVRHFPDLGRLGIRLAKQVDFRGPRRAPHGEPRVHAARQRRRILFAHLRLPAVPAGDALVHADEQLRGGVCGGPRVDHRDSPIPQFLCGWCRERARLQGEHPGPEGHVRQPVRRQHEAHQPVRAPAAHAGEIQELRSRQPVFHAGYVFSNDNVQFYAPDNVTPVKYDFGIDKLRYSTGVAVQWLAPMGVFRFSYAIPLNAQKAIFTEQYGDETENFQFSIGQAF